MLSTNLKSLLIHLLYDSLNGYSSEPQFPLSNILKYKINIKLKYSFCIYKNMFCNIFSKLFGKKEKDVNKIEDKKLEENA